MSEYRFPGLSPFVDAAAEKCGSAADSASALLISQVKSNPLLGRLQTCLGQMDSSAAEARPDQFAHASSIAWQLNVMAGAAAAAIGAAAEAHGLAQPGPTRAARPDPVRQPSAPSKPEHPP